jgi:mRNA interferase MazF
VGAAFPHTEDESGVAGIADWGPAEDWSDWRPMRRGEIWFAATPGGDRPVLVLTRDPVAERIGSVVVAVLTRTVRGLVSELELTPADDGVPSTCVVNFDNVRTISRDTLRRRVTTLLPGADGTGLSLPERCARLLDGLMYTPAI